MEREKFLGISFLKDKDKDLAFKEKDDSGLVGIGIPIKEMRKNILESKAEKDVAVSNLKFQRFLNDRGMFKESKEARKIDFSSVKIQNKKIVNEVSLIGGALLEGFLSFYTIEMDKALDKYENRLHVIEGEEDAYIAQISRDGDVKRVSPIMERDAAVEKLKAFERQNELEKEKETDRSFEIELRQEEERK
ncbi:hypothetical protein P8917_10100 [Bacillus atrophaeus]|uniref:hypothetical protein n=1 Tax=Bacillus atrophaeus TaxID=1452 RepID=UPI00227DE985|nr:hypothetical protein [Bacillus atrophaeus]MCY8497751.1 hypothetical protein [Bacillus atrophaeus]MCY8814944.1 hypothetical protein [Bacillus atrophaeus]MCY8821554.1 hypothetical protein [Bacillus atrophaeus]MCY8830984.1 hypothetical protein [Bacillus atrophaeus]MCY8835243.1 hypothetical protein [Bacillus atrophaeus]